MSEARIQGYRRKSLFFTKAVPPHEYIITQTTAAWAQRGKVEIASDENSLSLVSLSSLDSVDAEFVEIDHVQVS